MILMNESFAKLFRSRYGGWRKREVPRGTCSGYREGVTSMSNAPKTKSRLGRGLSSLISVSELPVEIDLPPAPPAPSGHAVATPIASVVSAASMEIPTDSILPNPHQPRKQFDEVGILSL